VGVKLKRLTSQDETEVTMLFFCPACQRTHPIRVVSGDPGRPVWDWNNDYEAPTFSPSLLVYPSPGGQTRCHSFLTAGRIEFCVDSEHDLADQTVDLPDFTYGAD
jgi:hypothetical protein